MAAARIAAILLAASVSVLSAQQETTTHLTICVSDLTGAPIPNARIDLTSLPEGHQSALSTDSQGRAQLAAQRGQYEMLVTSSGFCPGNTNFSVAGQPEQVIGTKLRVGSCPGPCSGPCVTVEPAVESPPLSRVMVNVIDTSGAIVTEASISVDPAPARLQQEHLHVFNRKGLAVMAQPFSRCHRVHTNLA